MSVRNTKELIIERSIDLFSENGLENVSLRDICNKVGIKASSIYNHFESKSHILDNIYSYYKEHYEDNRLSEDKLKIIVKHGSVQDILDILYCNFESPVKNQTHKMKSITKILFSRVFQDDFANNLFKELVDIDTKYMVKIVSFCLEENRFRSDIDPIYIAEILLSFRHAYIFKSLVDRNTSKLKLDYDKHSKDLILQMIKGCCK